MPEAPVNKNDLSTSREDEVRFSGKVGNVSPKSVSAGMSDFPHHDFWSGIFATDKSHALATLKPCKCVH